MSHNLKSLAIGALQELGEECGDVVAALVDDDLYVHADNHDEWQAAVEAAQKLLPIVMALKAQDIPYQRHDDDEPRRYIRDFI